MLEFCPKCQNLMRHSTVDEQLVMECRVCYHTQAISQPVIYSDDYRLQETEDYPVHADICLDKTLPRSRKIVCPNPKCLTNTGGVERETVMFHYNSDYAQGYLCCSCHAFIKNRT